ncbi:MAG: phage tail protein [Thiobacillus sp.]|nr:phage tail protein [Thiobacillus sp.]
MGKDSEVTIGYSYYIGMHQVFCLSPGSRPVTAVKKIRVGEKDAWTGNVTGNTMISIAEPELFGGEEKEGGIVGDVDIEFGGPTQGINSYLSAVLTGSPVPAFRGLLGLVLRQPMVSSMSPYIKPWSVYASRINGTPIGENMNPADIIYDLLTLPEFSIRADPSDIDLASFSAAAATLHAEGLGLSFFWEDEQPTEDFIGYILEHIDGSLYPDPASGQLTLMLARDDYILDDLPILDQSNILRVDRFSQPMPGELTSEIQIKFEDQATGEPASVTVQEIAIMEMQGGGVVPVVRDYQGIPDAATASKVALRELRTLSTPLARAEITCNRTAAALNVGGVFRLQWPPLGIIDMVMRVAEVDYGTLTSGKVVVVAVQDVFRAASTVIGVPADSEWVNPVGAPSVSPQRLAMEAPYWVVAREIFNDQASLIADVDPASGVLLAACVKPSPYAYDFRLYTRTGVGDYVDRAAGDFCPTAILDAAVGRTDTVFAIRSGVDLAFVDAGTWAHLDGELVKVVSVTESALTVSRGVLDTVPAPHAADLVIHFADGSKALDPTEWSSGQTVDAKMLPRTGLGTLLLASAPADSVVMAGRFNRPYPPGNVLVNGVSYPSSVTGDLAITWAHRDRTLQTAYLVEQSETHIGPEPGTTYVLRVYNAQTGGTLLRTWFGGDFTSAAYTVAQATTDNGGIKPANIRIEIESGRDGYASWQMHQIPAAWV